MAKPPRKSFWRILVETLQGIEQALIDLGTLLGEPGHIAGRWLWGNLTTAAIQYLPIYIHDSQPYIRKAIESMVGLFTALGRPILQELEVPIGDWTLRTIVEKVKEITNGGISTPENAEVAAAAAMADAFTLGLSSHAVTAAFEAVLPEKLNTLNGVGPMLADFADFKDVAHQVLDPLYSNAFGKSLEYRYRAHFKPELPSEESAVRWHSQRLLTDAQLKGLFHYSGTKAEYEAPFVASAYRTVQPRALTSMFEDQPFPRDTVKEMLEFSGVRDLDLHTLLDAYEWNSTKNVRGQYLTAVISAAEKGTISIADLDGHLHSLEFSKKAVDFVHTTVSVKLLENLTELYRKSVTVLYETGQITDNAYVPALEAVGYPRNVAEAYYGVDSARLRGKVLAEEDRAETKLEEQRLREIVAGIRAQYMSD